MKNVLQVASVASMIDQFNMDNIRLLQELGYKVDVAANFEFGSTTSKKRVNKLREKLINNDIEVFNLLFDRRVFNFINIKVYKQLKNIINNNNYNIIHCHSPIGGVITRLAAREARKRGTKVIYTAHGFHFFKGGGIKNWILFYPIERMLAKYTDIIITINKEDYKLAKKRFKDTEIKYVPGIGIDLEKINKINVNNLEKKKQLSIPNNSKVLLSVGELNKNKNHEVIIKAISRLNDKSIYYLICGKGELEPYLNKLISKLNLDNQVKLLGYRSDIYEISKISDIFIFPSFREGLSVALMEAMASGLPVICSDIRGNRDLIQNCKGGYLVKRNNIDKYEKFIRELIINEEQRNKSGKFNIINIKKYSNEVVSSEMKNIYYSLNL